MFNRNWSSSFTFDERYEITGVNDRVLEYVRQNSKKNLIVLDVGCSTGIAVNTLQQKLKHEGLDITTIGIDVSPKVKKESEKNLDRFILGDILKIETKPDPADVVICSKMILFVNYRKRAEIISKCSEF